MGNNNRFCIRKTIISCGNPPSLVILLLVKQWWRSSVFALRTAGTNETDICTGMSGQLKMFKNLVRGFNYFFIGLTLRDSALFCFFFCWHVNSSSSSKSRNRRTTGYEEKGKLIEMSHFEFIARDNSFLFLLKHKFSTVLCFAAWVQRTYFRSCIHKYNLISCVNHKLNNKS